MGLTVKAWPEVHSERFAAVVGSAGLRVVGSRLLRILADDGPPTSAMYESVGQVLSEELGDQVGRMLDWGDYEACVAALLPRAKVTLKRKER